ncbi:MAG TPA: sigma-70 family RNA polymerase sigma factor [Pirellulaceae bacterium]|nr:sigma-70 family RNA polymerase sigma factor [Pirellulaceae bacterium]
MNKPGIETTALILQARNGCGSSLGALLDGYRAYLLRLTARRIAPDLRARLAPSDVVQGSLLIAARDFQQFRGDSERELRAWLLRIVTSQLVDGLRRFVNTERRRSDRHVRRGDSALTQTAENGETPSCLASLNEQAERLVESIESLPHELREVVQSRYLENLTFPQIAARMSLPVTTCRRRWLEAVDVIRQDVGIDP